MFWFSKPSERSSEKRALFSELLRKEALCTLGETGRTGLQIVQYFQESILWIQLLYLLISRKVLKTLHGDICFSKLTITFMRLAKTCKKKYVLDCVYSPFTKITYILTFPSVALGQYLRATLNVVSLAIVLILPQLNS